MKKLAMIPVVFNLDSHESPYQHLEYSQNHMPWLRYLCKNCLDLKIKKHYYDIEKDQTVVTYEFYLTPKKETYYRVKYSNDT